MRCGLRPHNRPLFHAFYVNHMFHVANHVHEYDHFNLFTTLTWDPIIT
jgi:hypothetical protein